ncbi:hypothetical protein OSTOST_06724, partial [Ostertagia ostertagi]
CWPKAAIVVTALFSYLSDSGLAYVLLYVPVVIGRPIRIIASCFARILRCCLSKALHPTGLRNNRLRQGRRRDIAELLAIVTLGWVALTAKGCQEVDIYSHRSTICTETEANQVCKVRLSEILKINPFKQEACFKLIRNDTTVHEIRTVRKNLVLTCEKETETFTRDVKLRVVSKGRSRSYSLYMRPNVPIKLNEFELTLTSSTVPPIPLLSTWFVTNGDVAALWDSKIQSLLLCPKRTSAENLWCDISDDCQCYPAVIKVNCRCKQVNISAWFTSLQYHLPITTPSAIFRKRRWEITLSSEDELETTIVVQDNVCNIEDTELSGSYNCTKGAIAQIAETTCDSSSFTVLCDEKGIASSLRFNLNRAIIFLKCSVSCGKNISSFELSGILKFAHTTHGLLSALIKRTGRTAQTYSGLIFRRIHSLLQNGRFGNFLGRDIGSRCSDPFDFSRPNTEGNLLNLVILLHDPDPTERHVEKDLETVLNAFHDEIGRARAIRTQWQCLSVDGSFLETSPTQKLVDVSRCLYTALVSRETILRMGTRYVLSDLIYHHQVQRGRLSQGRRDEWLRAAHEHDVRSKQVSALTEEYARRMETTIIEMRTLEEDAEESLCGIRKIGTPTWFTTFLEKLSIRTKISGRIRSPNI